MEFGVPEELLGIIGDTAYSLHSSVVSANDIPSGRRQSWRGRHHHAPLVTAAQAFLTLRRLDPKAHTPV
jgi:hypothetical protein